MSESKKENSEVTSKGTSTHANQIDPNKIQSESE